MNNPTGTFSPRQEAPIDEYKLGMWTIKRSLKPLPIQAEEQAVKASWTAGEYFYTLWESETGTIGPMDMESHVRKVRDWVNFGKQGAFVSATEIDEWESLTTPPEVIYEWLAAKKPSFQFPKVLYHAEHDGHYYKVETRLPGRSLETALGDLLGRDTEGRLLESGPYCNVVKAIEVCDRVSSQVLDAVVEMSMWTGESVGGVDGKRHPDPDFAEFGIWKPFEQDELLRNCQYAGLDCSRPVFTIGDLGPLNTMVDDEYNFIGFNFLGMAGYSPKDWVQVGFVEPAAKKKAYIAVHWSGVLDWSKSPSVPESGSIRLMWLNKMSDKLAKNGFGKLDPHRLPWLRRRDVKLHGVKWTEMENFK